MSYNYQLFIAYLDNLSNVTVVFIINDQTLIKFKFDSLHVYLKNIKYNFKISRGFNHVLKI